MAEQGKKSSGQSAGELLSKARQQEQRSVPEVAQALHLDEWIVEALEADEYQKIGAPVFVKGHLRKYAELMEVNVDDVIAGYYRSENAPPQPPVVTSPTEVRRSIRISSSLVMTIVAVLVIILIAVWWVRRDEPTVPAVDEEVPDTTQTEAQEPVVNNEPEPETSVTTPPVTAPQPVQTAVSEPQQTEPEPPVQTAGLTPEPAAAPDGELRLNLSFANESWVEIRDANGRRLYFGMAQSGSSPSVTGVPPLDVLLGNTAGVRLQVNGEAFNIPAGSRRGRTARFQVQ